MYIYNRHELVAIEVRVPPILTSQSNSESGSRPDIGARLHFDFTAVVPSDKSLGPRIDTALPLFRSEVLSAESFRKLSRGEADRGAGGSSVTLHFRATASQQIALDMGPRQRMGGANADRSQIFVFKFVNFNRVSWEEQED